MELTIGKIGFDNFVIEDNRGRELLTTDSTGIEYLHEQMRFSLHKKCIEDLENEINKQNDRILDLEQETCQLEDENDALKEENWELKEKVKALQEKIKEIEKENDATLDLLIKAEFELSECEE